MHLVYIKKSLIKTLLLLSWLILVILFFLKAYKLYMYVTVHTPAKAAVM